MADEAIRTEDVLPVRSRVSWGAIIAGAMTALAVYFLLGLLGLAMGLSVVDNVSGENFSTGAAIYAILASLVSLFLGGWVASQCTAGENAFEAMIYGVVLWGVMFAIMAWFAVNSIQVGFSGLLGVANVASANRDAVTATSTANFDRAARELNLSQEQIDRLRNASATDLRQAAQDPQNRAVAQQAAWWTFAGTLLSMLAAVGGALAGCGPNLAIRGFVTRRFAARTVTTPAPRP